MNDHLLIPAYTILGVVIAGAIVIASLSHLRRRRMRRLVRLAALSMQTRKFREALHLYVKADACWAVGTAPGSRKSFLRDLAEASGLWLGIAECCRLLSYPDDSGPVLASIEGLRGVFLKDNNFRWDNRSMRPGPAVEFAGLFRTLQDSRKSARERVLRKASP